MAPVMDHLSYLADAPLIVGTVLCIDIKNSITSVGYTAPYRAVTVGAGVMSFPVELIPVYALYREAKNATSNFYRLLCYYKILEGIYNTLRPQVFAAARDRSVQLTREKEVVPEHSELRKFQPELIGRAIKDYFDNTLQKEFRDLVAHYILNSGSLLNPSDPSAISRFSNAILVTELCCRVVIAQHERYLQQLNGGAAQPAVEPDKGP
jgi:hypothetical protein